MTLNDAIKQYSPKDEDHFTAGWSMWPEWWSQSTESWKLGFLARAHKESCARVKELETEMTTAYEYLKTFSCADNCEPEVDFHQAECCITRDFKRVLKK